MTRFRLLAVLVFICLMTISFLIFIGHSRGLTSKPKDVQSASGLKTGEFPTMIPIKSPVPTIAPAKSPVLTESGRDTSLIGSLFNSYRKYVIYGIAVVLFILIVIIIILVFRWGKSHTLATSNSRPVAKESTVKRIPKKPGKIIPGNAQHIGRREQQQDAFGFSEIENAKLVRNVGVLAVLADGMGGLEMGCEASNLAVRAMLREYVKKPQNETIPLALRRVLDNANQTVYQMSQKCGLESQVGTTLVAAVIREGELFWVSVGDSRIYLYRGGSLTRLTEDHVYAQTLERKVLNGDISREEAEHHPDRNALTSYLGLVEISEVDQNIKPLSMEIGDRVVLCSDGIYKVLSDNEIAGLLNVEPQTAAEMLVEKALGKNETGQDNMTVAILAYV